MKSLFDADDRAAIVRRLNAMSPAAQRQWGTMTAAQALAHCSAALETGTGDRPMKQVFIGKILAPLVKKSVLGEKPFGRSSPTDPTFVVKDDRDLEAERKRLIALIERLAQRGPDAAATQTHPFFGRLTGEGWGVLMFKHIDHHLRQFGL